MKDRFLTGLTIFVSILTAFTLGFLLGQSRLTNLPIPFVSSLTGGPSGTDAEFSPFWEVWTLVHDEYFDQPLDDEALVAGAIDGLLATLGDPNTIYLEPEREEAQRERLDGEYEGIGTVIEEVDGHVVIVAPFEGSPAEAAGLMPGDILLEADGVALEGLDASAVADLVRGPAGTTVHLVVDRAGERLEFDVERDSIRLPSVRGEMRDDGLAYVRLSRFSDQTAAELNETLTTLMAQSPRGIILDLRGNPGGSLPSVVDVADAFLAEQPVLTQRFGNGTETHFTAEADGLAQDVPLVVLIDGGSASAAEVLAGAIRDNGRGILIGETSYGKGTVQTWYRLSNGGGVRITSARWLTPSGEWVHGTGLAPDIVVPLPIPDNPEDFVDLQLQAAVDYLLGDSVTSR